MLSRVAQSNLATICQEMRVVIVYTLNTDAIRVSTIIMSACLENELRPKIGEFLLASTLALLPCLMVPLCYVCLSL